MLECGHDWGYVGEHEVGESEEVEPHASGTATCTELDSTLVTKIEELGVRVWVDGVWGWRGPAVDEFDKDEGTGPHGSAHVHRPIVLLERNEGVAHWELDYWGVCELHYCAFPCSRALMFLLSSTKIRYEGVRTDWFFLSLGVLGWGKVRPNSDVEIIEMGFGIGL